MLYTDLLHNELESKRGEFADYFRRSAGELARYRDLLEKLCSEPRESVMTRLAAAERAGAIPAEELGKHGNFCASFGVSWSNHERAREWAETVLAGRTTFAADGSQIYAEKETMLPIGAIQIGWFENPHEAAVPFEKNAKFEILSPEDLLAGGQEPLNPETRIGERRFHAEADKTEEFLTRKRGWSERGERMPLAFFDGTLLISFSLPRTSLQESFVNRMVRLVKLSAECRVPLVGYVDRSFARDIVSMIDALYPPANAMQATLYDSAVLSAAGDDADLLLPRWGDRTCFCYSRRSGLVAFDDPDTGRSAVGFTYLQTTSDAVPARLDVPSWIYDEGLLDETLDIVRAECIAGIGYPYALEAADQTAVIAARDRDAFLRALQDFAKREKLGFSVSRKSASKGRRR